MEGYNEFKYQIIRKYGGLGKLKYYRIRKM